MLVTPVSALEPDGSHDVQNQTRTSDTDSSVTRLELEAVAKADSVTGKNSSERDKSTEYTSDSVSARSRHASGQR